VRSSRITALCFCQSGEEKYVSYVSVPLLSPNPSFSTRVSVLSSGAAHFALLAAKVPFRQYVLLFLLVRSHPTSPSPPSPGALPLVKIICFRVLIFGPRDKVRLFPLTQTKILIVPLARVLLYSTRNLKPPCVMSIPLFCLAGMSISVQLSPRPVCCADHQYFLALLSLATS
jgi:hypothetical protein